MEIPKVQIIEENGIELLLIQRPGNSPKDQVIIFECLLLNQ